MKKLTDGRRTPSDGNTSLDPLGGDVVQIYEEGDGMYICNRYQIILSIL
jgi:hypothetical protein